MMEYPERHSISSLLFNKAQSLKCIPSYNFLHKCIAKVFSIITYLKTIIECNSVYIDTVRSWKCYITVITRVLIFCLICTPLFLGPAALGNSGVHIRQITRVCVTTIKYMQVLRKMFRTGGLYIINKFVWRNKLHSYKMKVKTVRQ